MWLYTIGITCTIHEIRSTLVLPFFLDVGRDLAASRDQHPVPHGKLVAYKSYNLVIKVFNLIGMKYRFDSFGQNILNMQPLAFPLTFRLLFSNHFPFP